MRFSRQFSRYFTATLLVSLLSACAYIIPPQPNEPRNNTVQGEIRKPLNNPASSGKRSDVAPRTSPTAAPVTPVQQAALPPVDSAVRQRAESIVAASSVADNSGRRVPAENAQFQVSSNGYPAINAVPEAPAMRGADSAQSRLNAAQAELEMNRSSAMTAKDTLAKDAAAEPSMLSELPKVDGVVPANDPIQVTPMVQQAPQVAPPTAQEPVTIPMQIRRMPVNNEVPRSSITPAISAQPVASIAPRVNYPETPVVMSSSLPNIPIFAPPAALIGRAPEPAPRVATAAMPVPSPTITASAPSQSFVVDLSPAAPAGITAQPLPAPAFAASAPHVRAGDFDPLAVADNAPIAAPAVAAPRVVSSSYVANRYISPSRYSGLRN